MPTKMKTFLVLFAFIACAVAQASNPLMVVKNQFGEQYNQRILQFQGASFQSTPVVLSAAQVKLLNVTPIVLVGSVAGKVIQVVGVDLAYSKSTAFAVSNPASKLIVNYNTSGVVASSIVETGFIDASSSKEAMLFHGGGGLGIRGEAIEITSNGSTGEITSGTASTVTATVFYNVLQ